MVARAAIHVLVHAATPIVQYDHAHLNTRALEGASHILTVPGNPPGSSVHVGNEVKDSHRAHYGVTPLRSRGTAGGGSPSCVIWKAPLAPWNGARKRSATAS